MEFVRNILLQTVQRVRKKENAIIIFFCIRIEPLLQRLWSKLEFRCSLPMTSVTGTKFRYNVTIRTTVNSTILLTYNRSI